jgi:hypothetical protein
MNDLDYELETKRREVVKFISNNPLEFAMWTRHIFWSEEDVKKIEEMYNAQIPQDV